MIRHRKKGFLFTAGLTFLMLVVLALAILIFHNTQKSEEMVNRLAVLDRVYELDNSIKESVKDIFFLKSGILINITDNRISFEETLPNNMKEFNGSIFQFKRFIESNISNVNFTIGDIEKLPLRVMPNDIVYRHKDNGSSIEVTAEQINFNGYSLFIIINKNVSCVWDIEQGSFNLSLEVKGDKIDCEKRTEQIDLSEDNKIEVNSISGENIISIEIENGVMLVDMAKDISIGIKTTLLMSQPIDKIVMDSIVIGFDFSKFGIYKESKAMAR